MKAGLLALVSVLPLAGCIPAIDLDDQSQQTIGSLQKIELAPVVLSDADKSRDKAIYHYRAFLEESPNNQYVPEALRRLADLELEVKQAALAEGKTPPGKSTAAQLYAELLQRFPDLQNNDSTLYELAHAYDQDGEIEPAMKALTTYSSQYHHGEHYGEVQFRRAEFLFMHRHYAQAEKAYQAVLNQGEDSPFHQQSLYKLGWSQFKQSHHTMALDTYMHLLDETISQVDSAELPITFSRINRERIDDTLRAISLSFSYLGGSTTVRDYFARQGNRSYEPLIYASLAALYLGKQRYTDAAEIYALFAKIHPGHDQAPMFQSRVIDVYKRAGFGQRVLQEKKAYIERYLPSSAYWKQHNPLRSPNVRGQVQRHLRDVARHYHAVAQASGSQKAYAEAGHWYQLYLRAFTNTELAPYMNFLYAELLSSAGQYGRAAAQYERTAYDYRPHDKAAEAGYAAVLAYDKHEAKLQGQKKANWHRTGIASALRFAETFPEHKQARRVRLRAAQQLYALKDYPAAIAAARPLTEQTQTTQELQLAAWTVIAHAEFDQAEFQQAEYAYHEVLARLAPTDKQHAKFEENLAASIYKQGEQEKTAGNLAGAVEQFLRIATAVPGSRINIIARYDAAAALITLKQWPRAIHILEKWRRDNPGHRLQGNVTRKLAVLYRKNHQLLQAADEFVRLSDNEKDPVLRREATLTAAGLYRQTKHDSRAIAAYKRFIKRYPQPVEAAMEARYELVKLYTRGGQTHKQRFWLQQLIKMDRRAGKQRSDRTRYLAAHAQLTLVADADHACHRIQLREPLKKSLARKKKYLQAAIKGYKAAATYKVAEVTTESAYRIGDLYRNFGHSLLASERPHNLKGEELEQYDLLLEDQAYPFEEKAIAIHETNARRISTGIYDTWVRKSMRSLAELLPVRYAKPEKGERFVAILQ